MDKRETFFGELGRLIRLRLWIIPWAWSIIFAYAGTKTMLSLGAEPTIFCLTALGFVGALLLPMIPTKRDLLAHFTRAVETIDAGFEEKKFDRDQAEELLTQASSYAHHRNAVWWPLWWLSERGKLRRLLAASAM